MRKHGLSFIAAVTLILALAAVALAQTTQTTVTKTVQNPDGSYTIIEYPAKKEVTVTLNPVNTTATGVATILRDDDGTRIKLNLANVPADLTALTLYAIDDTGAVTALGPVAITNGTGTLATTTPLTKFMLVASPEAALTAYDPNTRVFFRSAVPQGFAVIPVTRSASGENVGAVTAPTATVTAAPGGVVATQYTAPLLGVPGFKKGDDTKIKVDFSGAMSGARANVFITPEKGAPTKVELKFHDLKEAPAGQKFVAWAVGANGEYMKLGEVVTTGNRNEAQIKTETIMPDFGLLITMESAIGASPVGPGVAHIHIVP
ncbi:MAG TPA: hypothetical protein VL907_11860 [Pyrinomonadaceae bacterium]|jgi:hypothetical protein|nr:hypothetical protein [Pyrinomonadaceae bacterium]